MVWHARRRQTALAAKERFLQDASHELRTPVTVARGHLEVLARTDPAPEIDVALDELNRMERLVGSLLLLAKSDQADFLVPVDVAVEAFLEDVFMRWSEVAPRAWRLGPVALG